jgi:hypothetical protein
VRRNCLVILGLTTTMLTLPLAALGADPPLSLELSEIAGARYSQASMPVRVTLENVSNEPLRVLDSFGERHALRVFFCLHIRSADGETNTAVGGGKIDLPLRLSRYIALKRGEKYELTLDLADLVKDEVRLRSGTYTMTLTYSNQYGEACFQGSVTSRPVQITLGDQ